MSHSTRRSTRLLVTSTLVTLVAVLGAALGAAAAPRHATEGPIYGGTMRVAYGNDFAFLDPAEATEADYDVLYSTMFDGLYKYDRNGQPQLDLAAAPPTVSADGKTWTFKLRKGVLFSNGMEMTAQDFKYSITRTLDPHLKPISYCQPTNNIFVGSQAYISGTVTDVSGIQALDRYTLRFRLTQPTPDLPYLLAIPCNTVVPQAVVSKETEQQFSNNPIGTGPFMLQSWQKGVQATFVKNPRYFRTGKPYLNKVIVYLNVAPSVIALRIQHGDLDAFGNSEDVATPDLQQFQSDPKFRSYIVVSKPWISIWLEINVSDPQNPILKSLQLRQAIAMAIDRQRLVQLDGGNATVTYQLYLPQFPQWDPALANHAVYPYDPTRAAALVKASGYKGQTLIYLDRRNTPYFQAIAPGIQQQLQQIGLNVKIDTLAQTAAHVIRLQLTGHQLNPFDWGVIYYDAWNEYSYTMDCAQNGDGGFSGSHYCDPAADALAHRAEHMPLGPARDALFRQAQMRILQSATKIPLINPKNIEIASPRIGGFYYQPTIGMQYENYWIKP